MSIKTPALGGFTLRFQLYTVPGQTANTTTRQLVLRGVDALIFVVDSAWNRMPDNVESFQDLQRNLAFQDHSSDTLSLVFQYNKRDLPNADDIEYLEHCFNTGKKTPACLSGGGNTGRRRLETLNAVSRMLMLKYSLAVNPDATPSTPLPRSIPR